MKTFSTSVFTQSLRRFLPAAVCGALLLPIGHSEAAVGITWGAPSTISGDSDVVTTNSLLYAYTFGDTGVSSATVNGVTFTSFAAANGGAGPVTVGGLTLTLSTDTFNSTNTGAGSASAPFSSLSANYKGLLQSGVADNTGNQITVGLTGLTSGFTYTIEVWTNDSVGTLTAAAGNPADNDNTVLHALNTATLDDNGANAAGGVGQYVIGTLSAFSTGATFTVTAGPAGAKPEIAAIQVRYVPEPATFGLLGLGAAALLARRRRN